MLGSEFDGMIVTGPCIRCAVPFQFDPHTVPSVSINPATRCAFNLDGTPVIPGSPDAVRAQLCPSCAEIHQAAARTPARATTLYPHANWSRIDFPCACEHRLSGHHLTPGGQRTRCLHQDAEGPCECAAFRHHPDTPQLAGGS